MFEQYIDKYSINNKTSIFRKFFVILEASKLCKTCNLRSYEYQPVATLDIRLKKK